jgi:hypothetical protein
MQIRTLGGRLGKKAEQQRRIRVGTDLQQRLVIIGPSISHDLIDKLPGSLLSEFLGHRMKSIDADQVSKPPAESPGTIKAKTRVSSLPTPRVPTETLPPP